MLTCDSHRFRRCCLLPSPTAPLRAPSSRHVIWNIVAASEGPESKSESEGPQPRRPSLTVITTTTTSRHCHVFARARVTESPRHQRIATADNASTRAGRAAQSWQKSSSSEDRRWISTSSRPRHQNSTRRPLPQYLHRHRKTTKRRARVPPLPSHKHTHWRQDPIVSPTATLSAMIIPSQYLRPTSQS